VKTDVDIRPIRPARQVARHGFEEREMLLIEALSRARMREAQEAARRYRQVRRLTARRRWEWLAHYAARRAERVKAIE
jgi:GrpB-like predicted nucleotidyltransferase (UPF0157 family)